MNKVFPNGFSSWLETYHEIVSFITIERLSDKPRGNIKEVSETQGIGGIYELAEDWTDKFEKEFEGYSWADEGDGYFETLENWLEAINNSK